MTSTGLEVFDTTLQESNHWLKGVMRHLPTKDRHAAYLALRAVFHVLRDRIGPENAVHLAAQLPMLLRGLYFEGWHMAGTPTKERRIEDFLDRIQAAIPDPDSVDSEAATRAVFRVMCEELDGGEVVKLIGVLPSDLRPLWPPSAAAA